MCLRLLDHTSEFPPGAPVPTVSPAVWCRVTPAGDCGELSLPVCLQPLAAGSQACTDLCLESSSLGKAGLVLSINYCFFIFTPILNNKTNQHLCVCVFIDRI